MHLVEQFENVGGGCDLAAIAAREGKIILKHVLHFIDIIAQRLDLGAVAKQGQLQFEPCQHCSEVMADAGEHGGALFDMLGDAVTHFEEGLGRLPDFAGAAGAEIGGESAALAEAVGGLG